MLVCKSSSLVCLNVQKNLLYVNCHSCTNPWKSKDCMILLCSVVECDRLSMSIIICLVCPNVVTGSAMLSLCKCDLFMFVDFVFVGVCMVCKFMSWLGCRSCVLSWEFIGGFICASIIYILLFHISCHHGLCLGSELDWDEIEIIDAGVLWFTGGGRQLLVAFGLHHALELGLGEAV